MPRFVTGVVVEVLERRPGVIRSVVEVEGSRRRATAFPEVTGDMAEGDRVVLNTTAVDLGLGTGGEDFVLWNLARGEFEQPSGGHIMKVRYTPWQIDTLVTESPESPHHAALSEADSLGGVPVIACSVHSQISPVASMLRERRPSATIAYLMTDGAALPLPHSDLVSEMCERGLIDLTVTTGHAFGGDLESVNIFSGMVAAFEVGHADVIVAAPGPGVVGTGTALGHTGMEQAQVLSAAAALEGRPVAVLRISFADPRPRHNGVSHHSLTALRIASPPGTVIGVPVLDKERAEYLAGQLQSEGISSRHDVRTVDATRTIEVLHEHQLSPTTMGRTVEDDPEFFLAAGAAALALTDEEWS